MTMCNVSVPQEVNDVVVEFIQQGKVFTAYDVTVEARKRTTRNVRHSDVRQMVAGIINNDPAGAALYFMTTITLDIPGKGNPQAVVHYPMGVDPQSHPMAVKTSAPVTVDNGSPADAAPVDDGGDAAPFDGDEVVEVTVEGRLNIPKKILSSVNTVGNSYDISFLGNVVSRIPDKDGRVRLGKKIVGKNPSDKYKVEFDENLNCVMVSAVTSM
jgi:hypothetical protein